MDRRRGPKKLSYLLGLILLGALGLLLTRDSAFDSLVRQAKSDPNLTLHFYQITVREGKAVAAALKTQGPSDSDGQVHQAYTGWKLSWEWPTDAQGCTALEQVEVRYEIRVDFPEWLHWASTDSVCRREWQRYRTALARHELFHVENVRKGAAALKRAVRAAARGDPDLDYQGANAIALSEIERIRERDQEFDRRSNFEREAGFRWEACS